MRTQDEAKQLTLETIENQSYGGYHTLLVDPNKDVNNKKRKTEKTDEVNNNAEQ